MSLVISIIALGLIITVHELGHFAFAKLFGVGVIEFSLGMGPVLFSKVKGQTKYSLRLLPLGGSCMMLGEESEETDKGSADGNIHRRLSELTNGTFNGDEASVENDTIYIDGRSYGRSQQFCGKKAWERFLIIFAGPLFNFILAFFLSLILTSYVGWDRPLIVDVDGGSPAYEAGMRGGDHIALLSIDDRASRIETARDIRLFFTANERLIAEGHDITFIYKRGSAQGSGVMRALYDSGSGRYLCGFSYSFVYEPCADLGELLRFSFYNIKYCFKSTLESLRMILRGDVRKNDVVGIVGMVAVMDENVGAAAEGGGAIDAALTLINIMILLCGTIGVMNLLPIPALDGGRLVFIIIEMLTGRAVPRRIEGIIHGAGMAVLLILMLLLMLKDIGNLIF